MWYEPVMPTAEEQEMISDAEQRIRDKESDRENALVDDTSFSRFGLALVLCVLTVLAAMFALTLYLINANEDQVIHAALPASLESDFPVRRNVNEAIRVLPAFLNSLPDAKQAVTGRQLGVRMISSYDRLDDEMWNRTLVPWSMIFAGGDRALNTSQRCNDT